MLIVPLNSNKVSLNSNKVSLNSNNVSLNSNKVSLNSNNVLLNSNNVSLNSNKVSLNSSKVSLNSNKVSLNSSKVSLNSNKVSLNTHIVRVMLIVEDLTVTVKFRTIKKMFLYFDLCLNVMFDNLSCPFTSTSFLTNKSAIINIKKIDHSGNGCDSNVFQKTM
jgi:hypothetical protein